LLVSLFLNCYALSHADKSQANDEKTAAVAKERQRNAGNGHDAHIHADIDENMKEKQTGDAENQKHAEIILGASGDRYQPVKNDTPEPEQKKDAEQAQFLRDDRKHKVGLAFRHEPELALRAESQSPAKPVA
jgi:hypothetical protein